MRTLHVKHVQIPLCQNCFRNNGDPGYDVSVRAKVCYCF
uniref:Uncharacterized protein n=1 Tax=Anguilla anguilla TaxID=7936 RepID=A0A0E9S2S5_ANGAN